LYASHDPVEFADIWDNMLFLKDGKHRVFSKNELPGDISALSDILYSMCSSETQGGVSASSAV
ncbi:MAG: hypothetical protein IJG63_04565, partial [Oscillospiraceae bacterium]|nr:hypothetical protein [Oscillospiraceae bacterium]